MLFLWISPHYAQISAPQVVSINCGPRDAYFIGICLKAAGRNANLPESAISSAFYSVWLFILVSFEIAFYRDAMFNWKLRKKSITFWHIWSRWWRELSFWGSDYSTEHLKLCEHSSLSFLINQSPKSLSHLQCGAKMCNCKSYHTSEKKLFYFQ